MVTRICPKCNQRYIVSEGTGEIDFVHECNSGIDAVDQEDVLVVGGWEDYTGSSTDIKNVNYQGSENKLFGTRADIEGEDLEDLSERGKSKSTHRQRQHEEYIKLKGGSN